MKKTLALFTLFTLALSLSADVVKIGLILPLSGNNANIGEWQRSAAELFQKELVKRKLKHEYQLVFEDDQLTGRLTAEACNKLINIDHVAGIVSFSSGSGNVIAPRAEHAHVLHIGEASDPKVAKGTYNFINWTPPSDEAELFAKYVAKKHYKRIAVLALRQQGVVAIIDSIKQKLPTGTIIDTVQFNPGERDFRVILDRIAEEKPDLLLLEAFSPELQIVLRQRQQEGLHCDITGIECFDFLSGDDEEIKSVNGVYHISAALPTSDFVHQLKASGFPEAHYAMPFTYDSIGLLVDALEECPNPNKDRMPAVKYLEQVKNRPAAVGTLTIDAQHILHSPAGLYEIQGKFSVPAKLENVK